MVHNNGQIGRPVSRGKATAAGLAPGGLSEAAGAFRHIGSAPTGAEMAAFVPHRPERPQKSEGVTVRGTVQAKRTAWGMAVALDRRDFA